MVAIDKQLHFFSGGFLAALAIAANLPFYAAMLVVLLAGVAKEVYDALHPDKHTKDVWDIVATSIGGSVVVGAFFIGSYLR